VKREAFLDRRARAVRTLKRLGEVMPEARIELDFKTPLELLVAVILSAQCTDKRVNLVTPALFRRYPDANAYAQANDRELQSFIKSCGFFRNKSKNIKAAARRLVESHEGQVPKERAALEQLPGVGRKTAGVVAIHLGHDSAFPVDTHVGRLARRLGFTQETNPDKVELALQELVPGALWNDGHQLLVWHGRRTCFAKKPACDRCQVRGDCPQVGVTTGRKEAKIADLGGRNVNRRSLP
jgi:endonuclease-3